MQRPERNNDKIAVLNVYQFTSIDNLTQIDIINSPYNVPYRVYKFKSSFPEIGQVKVPIPNEMDR